MANRDNKGKFIKGGKINLGRRRAVKERKNMGYSEGQKKRLPFSSKTRLRMSSARKGKKLSSETRKKQSEAKKRQWQSGLSGYERIRGKGNWLWVDGRSKEKEKYTIDWTATLRRSIRERDNYICQRCGAMQGDEAFIVHHKDIDKTNCSPNNLITLCRPCHMTIHSIIRKKCQHHQ